MEAYHHKNKRRRSDFNQSFGGLIMVASKGRKIVILGISHCGSTLTSVLFNSVPGVVGLGETHWLTKGIKSQCTFCGPSCSIVSKLDIKNLNDWILYDELLKASGKEVLVTSDKALSFVEPCIRHKGFDAIILFKRPEAFAASGVRGARNIRPVKALPSLFVDWYESFLSWTKAKARLTVVLEYERLTSDVNKTFPRLCRALHLPSPKMPLSFPPPNSHNVQGNPSTFKAPRYKNKPIVLDDRWRAELTKAEKNFIRNHTACQRTWQKLKKLAV
jgi:hypothetical protein